MENQETGFSNTPYLKLNIALAFMNEQQIEGIKDHKNT